MKMRLIDIIRYVIILGASALLTFLIPVTKPVGTISVIPCMLMFSFLIAFLINRAMERRQKLSENVSIELSFLRRIKHLSENISDRAWQEKMITALKEYQKKLSENFLDRGRVLGSSRRFTHLIYKFEPSNRYEEVIMQDLLSVTRELAQKRQYIEEYLNYRFLPTSWLTLITVGAFVIILLILNRESSILNQLGTFFGVAVILLCLDFIRQKNSFNKNDVQEYQERYKKNITKTKE